MESPRLTPTRDADWPLALAYAPAALRDALEAVHDFDVMLSATAHAPRNPDLSRLRLAWWRDAVGQLPEVLASPDPLLVRLKAIARTREQASLLSDLAEAWMMLVPDGMTSSAERLDAIQQRGRAFFRLFSPDDNQIAELWSLRDFGECPDGVALSATASRTLNAPLAILGELARRDLVRLRQGRDALPVLKRMMCAARIGLRARLRK